MTAPPSGRPLGVLEPVPTDRQEVSWLLQPWVEELEGHAVAVDTLERLRAASEQAEDGSSRLTLRGRDPVREASEATDPRSVLVAAMVWGFGTVGYGPWRTREMLDTNDAIGRLQRLADAAASDPVEAFGMLLRRSRRPRWLGPAFGTKFLHFAAPALRSASADVRLPLVLDANVISGLEVHGHPELSRWAWMPDGYRQYLEAVHGHAQACGSEPDDVEYALFLVGLDRRRSTSARCG